MLKGDSKKLINKALKIVAKCKGTTSLSFIASDYNQGVVKRVEILMHNADDLDVALQYMPRLARQTVCGGRIWAEGELDGIKISVCDVGKCALIYEDVAVPEIVATGKTVIEKRAKYLCPEGDIQAAK